MLRRGLAWLWGAALTSLVFASACSADKEPRRGEVIVAFQTDLSIPKDIKNIVISIYSGGQKRFQQTYPLNPDGSYNLPATLAIVEGNKSDPVTIRVVGLDIANEPHVIRQAVTTVPKERIALLHMPLQYLCVQQVTKGIDIDGTENYDDVCTSKEQTCISGECVPDEIDISALPDYDGALVFGGVSAPGLAGGQCLDVLGCFAQGVTVAPDADCSVALPGGSDENFNVGLVMPKTGQGICGPEACIVALEHDDLLGWKVENGRAMLPKAVCNRVGQDIDAIAVTSACVTKTTSVPTCGPWSSIAGDFSLDAGAPAEGGDGAVDEPCTNAADGTYCEWESVIGGSGESLRQCVGGKTVSTTDCTANGEICVDGAAAPAFCAPAGDGGTDAGDGGDGSVPNFCTGKNDGYYCSASDLIQCGGGNIANKTACSTGCTSVGIGSFCTPPLDSTALFLGNFCTGDAECGPLKCLKSDGLSNGSGPAYGMCTWPCTPGQDVCNAVSIGSGCHTFGSGDSYCLQGCTPSITGLSKCHGRVEQACAPLTDVGSGSAKPMCLPACGSDLDCGALLAIDAGLPDGGSDASSGGSGFCSAASGLCQPAQPSPSNVGTECPTPSTCIDSVCTPFSWTVPADAGDAGSNSVNVCSGGCSLGNFCGEVDPQAQAVAAACLLPTDPANIKLGNLGQCVQLCGCAPGYSASCPTGMECILFGAAWLSGGDLSSFAAALSVQGADGYCGPPVDPQGNPIINILGGC
ncbi:MAG: hypothetical protein R3B13_30950 [Polyangiaceae bacterium]